jgi:hypothetical protein
MINCHYDAVLLSKRNGKGQSRRPAQWTYPTHSKSHPYLLYISEQIKANVVVW